MADMFKTPWGTTVFRGPELIKALRSRYTLKYYTERLNQDESPFEIYGQEYGAGDTWRAVDPDSFKQSYEDELETVASGDWDDVLEDIFGFKRVQVSQNARSGKCKCGKSRCTGCGKCSKNLAPRKAPAKKTNAKKKTAARSAGRRC